MAITKKQAELDKIKFEKGIEIGADPCGTFDYCAFCNKELENPCDKAFKKMTADAKKKAPAKKPAAKKPCTKKSCAKKAEEPAKAEPAVKADK